ncbi:hypothetical protein [Nocardia stercoris]|uniref:hypothetical protein n=1 Tax=Nocardia stercoris TaxID=2483361 RepID=UPI0011C35302|nr:hypothetical protein [Nocardia stercoris]
MNHPLHTRRVRVLAAAALACLAAGCDSAVGIEGTDYTNSPHTRATTTSAAAVPVPPAAPVAPPAPPAPAYPVALAVPAPATAFAVGAFAADLQQSTTTTSTTTTTTSTTTTTTSAAASASADTPLEHKCWSLAPHDVDTMYTDKQPILAALAVPGVDDGSTVTWKGPAVTLVVTHRDIAAGYACPRVFQAGTEPGFTDADARHTVRRYLSRLTGSPVDPADTEDAFPLTCTSGWDPTGTGSPITPPLVKNPEKLTAVQSFDDQSLSSETLRTDYAQVSATVTTAAGTKEHTFTLHAGEQGYCIGDVTA